MSVSDPLTTEPVMPGEGTSSREIVRRTEQQVQVMPAIGEQEMKRAWKIATALAASRMFKDTTQAEQAFAKILIGRDLGLSPTQSMMAIDLVRGNVQLRGVLLASWVRRSPLYEYKVLEKSPERCRLLMLGFPAPSAWDPEQVWRPSEGHPESWEGVIVYHRGQFWEVLSPEEFTIADAEAAGLVKDQGAWKAHPRNMCFWRAISNGVKMNCPELLGGMPVYVEGEIVPDTPMVGSGSGKPAGITLPDEVEAVIRRAEEAGHHGLADRGTVELAVGGQSPEHVAAWVERANGEIDTLLTAMTEQPEGEPVDAEVVPEPDHEGLAVLEAREQDLLERIADAEARDDEDALGELSAELDSVQAEKAAMADANQGSLL